MDFKVEVTAAPVNHDDDWAALYRALDAVPGAVLVENPHAPILIYPVEATSPTTAALFVDGIAKLVGVAVVSMSITTAEPVDYDFGSDDPPVTPTGIAREVQAWLSRIPALQPI